MRVENKVEWVIILCFPLQYHLFATLAAVFKTSFPQSPATHLHEPLPGHRCALFVLKKGNKEYGWWYVDLPGYAPLTQLQSSLAGSSTYDVTHFPAFTGTIWLCPVTLFVLGEYPKYLYVRKTVNQKEEIVSTEQ